ncbi:hypothetical protein NDU88_002695 [Pleurodeles waltl]|uniref:Uncharacterized protein n=1 Tax=Pleurodeles waltl TaxID=8319 RepID=A0AAV7PBL7_PLEWA|nr:hypothetical protein NDU88_002695 [Pleurodeles waltl]
MFPASSGMGEASRSDTEIGATRSHYPLKHGGSTRSKEGSAEQPLSSDPGGQRRPEGGAELAQSGQQKKYVGSGDDSRVHIRRRARPELTVGRSGSLKQVLEVPRRQLRGRQGPAGQEMGAGPSQLQQGEEQAIRPNPVKRPWLAGEGEAAAAREKCKWAP